MQAEQLWGPFSEWLQANQGWIIALVSAALGSGVGSWWTQRAIAKREYIAAGRNELRAVNRGILICFAAVNAYAALKKQHVVGLVSSYKTSQANAQQALSSGAHAIHIDADMTSIPTPRTPVARLEELVFRDIGAGGRALAATTAVVECQQHLNTSLALRDALITEFRTSGMTDDAFARAYLALPQANSSVDARYRDSLAAIELYTNDCIFYAMVAAHDLYKYGKQLIRRHRGKIGSVRKNLNAVDWTSTDEAHLFPKSKDYEKWTRGFVENPKWWQFWRKPTPIPLPF